MNTLEIIELRTAQAMFNRHIEDNKDCNKKCICHYCEMFRRVLTMLGSIKKPHKCNR